MSLWRHMTWRLRQNAHTPIRSSELTPVAHAMRTRPLRLVENEGRPSTLTKSKAPPKRRCLVTFRLSLLLLLAGRRRSGAGTTLGLAPGAAIGDHVHAGYVERFP